MDIRDKIKEMKQEVLKLSDEEKVLKASMIELKQLIEDKKKKQSIIEELKKEEQKLLQELLK